MKFVALKTFWSPEMMSQYQAGLTYTARPAADVKGTDKASNHLRSQRAKLVSLLPQWRKDGLIALAQSDLPEATVGGTGKVI